MITALTVKTAYGINWFVCKISEVPVLEFYEEPL